MKKRVTVVLEVESDDEILRDGQHRNRSYRIKLLFYEVKWRLSK